MIPNTLPEAKDDDMDLDLDSFGTKKKKKNIDNLNYANEDKENEGDMSMSIWGNNLISEMKFYLRNLEESHATLNIPVLHILVEELMISAPSDEAETF